VSRVVDAVLALAARTLPAQHRPRWREEALGVLLAVRGPQRWWWTLDTVAKVPVLAWQYRRGRPRSGSVPWSVSLTIGGLTGMALILIGAATLTLVVDDDAAYRVLVVSLCGLLPLVTVRTWRWARRHATPAHYAIAALLIPFAGTGPFALYGYLTFTALIDASWLLVPFTLQLAFVPPLWLAAHGIVTLVRGSQPAVLGVLAMLAGIGHIGLYAGAHLEGAATLGMTAVPVEVGVTVKTLSLAVFLASGVIWSVWSAARLYGGHHDLVTA
jgi:hypothetical protein